MSVPPKVRWAELKPDEFRLRRDACPFVYFPLGLCEPHGHVAALGLDLIKAEYYCAEAARRFGGVVAPSQGYHIHECGFHAPWLADVVGEENPLLAALPPGLMASLFLYQLRAFANAGFQGVVAVSGHSGGAQEDLRATAAVFSDHTGLPVVVKSDPEWVSGRYTGDHAGRYELSQLLAIQPDLVDLGLLGRQHEPGSGGRLALGEDAAEATSVYGREINEAIISAIGQAVETLRSSVRTPSPAASLTYDDIEAMRAALPPGNAGWRSSLPYAGQAPVAVTSRWKPYERLTHNETGPVDSVPPSAPHA